MAYSSLAAEVQEASDAEGEQMMLRFIEDYCTDAELVAAYEPVRARMAAADDDMDDDAEECAYEPPTKFSRTK